MGCGSIVGSSVRHGGGDSVGDSARQREGTQGLSSPPRRAVRVFPSQQSVHFSAHWDYPRKHWAECKAQIDETGELDLSNKRRSGRPSPLTPTKAAALRKVNKENRSFTLKQVSDWLSEMGMDYSSETVRRWFRQEGAVKVARRIKPSLSAAQKEHRIDFICDQVDETTGEFLDQGSVIHLDESWFFLLRTKEKVRIFPGEDIPDLPACNTRATFRRSW